MEKASISLPHVTSLTTPFSVAPPGSKSIANRALPLAALALGYKNNPNETGVTNLPDGDDVVLMTEALRKLGNLRWAKDGNANISGTGYFSTETDIELFLGNSGTATRILSALLTAGKGTFRVTGVPRMYERPIGDLVDALKPLCGETEIIYDGEPGFPPLTIKARGLDGGKTTIRGNLSSQFVTGILMAMPLCKGPVKVEIDGTLVSAPYVDLTLKVMKEFGASVSRDGYKSFWIDNPTGYISPINYNVEPDASSASYFLAAAAIARGDVTVHGIDTSSSQGEAQFITALEKMGAVPLKLNQKNSLHVSGTNSIRGIDIDMDLMSDTGMTLAIVALFAEGRTTIRNVGNWRLKETDRLAAMATELRKLGATVEEGADWIAIDPPAVLTRGAVIDTYDDHRMAMCFSLVSLGPKGVPVTINDPGCVRKTYPGYWDEFAKMTRG